jgi:hypothetical protein
MRVRLLKPERGIGFATGRRGGVTAEPGSTPWAAASAAPAVGRRVRDGCTAWCLGRPRTRRATLWRPCARSKTTATRPSRARRRRGEHGGHGEHGEARKRGPRPGLALTAAAHACWGARLRAPWPTRARASGHARVANATRRSDTARRRRTVAASYGKGGKARRAARVSTKAAAPAENGIPAWLDGRHHQQRRGGAVAFRLVSKAAASTGEVRRRPHLGGLWLMCRRR